MKIPTPKDMKRLEKLRSADMLELLVCTALPLLLPSVFDVPEEWDILGDVGKWIIFGIGAICIFVYALVLQSRRNKLRTSAFEDKVARRAFSNAYALMEKKKSCLANKAYNLEYTIPHKWIPYDVHSYIGDICNEFRNTIAEITGIDREQMSVSLIYHYTFPEADVNDQKWRWIVGKESATSKSLEEYVAAKETVFYTLINGRTDEDGKVQQCVTVFANEKTVLEGKQQYYMSTRDKQHGKIGSIFSAKIVFGNNANNFVESILTVASYGKCFVDPSSTNGEGISAGELETIIVENVLPYYQRLIEAELGMLYLRHKGETIRTSK